MEKDCDDDVDVYSPSLNLRNYSMEQLVNVGGKILGAICNNERSIESIFNFVRDVQLRYVQSTPYHNFRHGALIHHCMFAYLSF
jgi:hypothetical protein